MGLIRKALYLGTGGVVAPRGRKERDQIRLVAAMQGKTAAEIRRAGGRYDFEGFWARGGITDVEPQRGQGPGHGNDTMPKAAPDRDPARMCPACGKPDVVIPVSFGTGQMSRKHRTPGGVRCGLSGEMVKAAARPSSQFWYSAETQAKVREMYDQGVTRPPAMSVKLGIPVERIKEYLVCIAEERDPVCQQLTQEIEGLPVAADGSPETLRHYQELVQALHEREAELRHSVDGLQQESRAPKRQ